MFKLLMYLSLFFIPMVIYGADCSNYPYGKDGFIVEENPLLLVSTITVPIDFDDIESVRDAKYEAILLAKAEMYKFLIDVNDSEFNNINEVLIKISMTRRKGMVAERKSAINRLAVLLESAKVQFRGAELLGECYTKGKEIRVSLFANEETIKKATVSSK